MEENYLFEITRYHGYLVVMRSKDLEIKKSSLDIFIREILENEEIMDAYKNGNLSFSNIDEFTRDEIKTVLDETINNEKMAVLSEIESE